MPERNGEKLEPIRDALYNACARFMEIHARGHRSEAKRLAVRAIIQFYCQRVRHGDYLPPPILESGNGFDIMAEDQVLEWVGALMREIELTRGTRYG